jgi:hypothetical protein
MLPADRGCPRGGEGGTSCHHPFPGRPGLSQSCLRRSFQTSAPGFVPKRALIIYLGLPLLTNSSGSYDEYLAGRFEL